MSGLDVEIRLTLEKTIDEILSRPKLIEERSRTTLLKMGVEPNLETVLSYLCGTLMGLVEKSSALKYDSLRDQDTRGALELLKRRAWEVRQAFISTRARAPL